MDLKQILGNLFSYWWLILFGSIILLFIVELSPAIYNRWRRDKRFADGAKWRSDQELLQWLRSMNPSEFEYYIGNLFSKLGYKTYVVGQPHDGGVDVEIQKDGIKSYIQCKKFITKEVKLGDVRDFYGALANKVANGKGYFITTNRFTLDAEKFAEDVPIELIDGYKLIEYIRMAGFETTTAKIQTPGQMCPTCGGNLVQKNGKYGPFYGCSNFPKCKYTLNKYLK